MSVPGRVLFVKKIFKMQKKKEAGRKQGESKE
jgi:hypothetical protein